MWRSVLVNKCADRYLLHRPQIQHFLFTEPAISQILLSLAYIRSPGDPGSTPDPTHKGGHRPTVGHLAFLEIIWK